MTQPRVAEHDDAEIVDIADQASDALLQSEHGLRQLVLEKGIAAAPADALEARPSSGSSGEANGSLSMATMESASPFTSTPSQKLPVASSTALPSSRNRWSSASRGA